MSGDDGADWIRARLPAFERFFCRNEADYYGVGWELARALGRRAPGYSEVGWSHGWPWMGVENPRQLVGFSTPDRRCLVPCEEHVEQLGQMGFGNTTAVGLPICYADPGDVERRPRSLLVMPAHTTWVHRARAWDEDGYARQIASLKDRFDTVVACVHSSCFRNGIWVNALRRAGIPCISGARTNDKNSLRAQATLFRSFEFVTGNQIGSFVAYGAFFGAKVSIWGEPADYAAEDYARDRLMSENPDILERYLQNTKREALAERFPWLVVEPGDAEERRAWGEAAVGWGSRREPAEIASLLRWDDAAFQAYYRRRVRPKIIAGRARFLMKNGMTLVKKRIGGVFR